MDEVSQIRMRLSILDLVRQYVPGLKKVGRQWKACCPFHKEKTPSFLVSEDKGLAYCFGCHKGGDIFAFYQEIEGVDFRQAVKELGEKVGIDIVDLGVSNITKNEKKTLYDLLDDVTSFYENLLWNDGTLAYSYLKNERGFSDEIIKKFRLGYSPDSFSKTTEYLLKKGYSKEEMMDAGIIGSKDTGMNETFDRFRHRIMIPIRDSQGRVIGFSSRILDTSRQEGKYVNSPETKVYNKSNIFYGIFESKDGIRENHRILIVEGNLDVIACHSAKVDFSLGISGTAFTDNHAEILRRKSMPIYLALDRDNAGLNALKMSLLKIVSLGLDIFVVNYAGKDPDEAIKTNSAVFLEDIDGAVDFVEGYFNLYKEVKKDDYNLSDVTKDILEIISYVPDFIKRDDLLKILVKLSGKSLVILERELESFINNTKNKDHKLTDQIVESSMNPIEKEILEIVLFDPELKNTQDFKERIFRLTKNSNLWTVVFDGSDSLSQSQKIFLNKHTFVGEQIFGDWSEDKRKKTLDELITKWEKDFKLVELKSKLSETTSESDKRDLMNQIVLLIGKK